MFGFFRKEKESDEEFRGRMEEEIQNEKNLGRLRAELYESQEKLYNMRKDILANGTLEQKVAVLSAECIERMTSDLYSQLLDNNLFLNGMYYGNPEAGKMSVGGETIFG